MNSSVRQVLHQPDNTAIPNGTTVYWTKIIEIAVEFVERLFLTILRILSQTNVLKLYKTKYHVKRANSFHHCPLGDILTSIQESNKKKKTKIEKNNYCYGDAAALCRGLSSNLLPRKPISNHVHVNCSSGGVPAHSDAL